MQKKISTLILAALVAAGVILAGCGSKEETGELELAPEAQTAEPLDDGNPPPGTLDPGTGQTTPGTVGLPGNKSGK